MIERIVENWLTNTNEREYQIPFCQVLVTQGYKVLHLSSHGQMEQGKDIIATDYQGIPCGFQLKTGDIDGTEYRKIKGEIQELVEIPINYPGIPKDCKRRAILVTNGILSDKVRRDIDDQNIGYKQRGYPELEVKTKMELLQYFIEAHGGFLPTELPDFKTFLELLLSNGHGLANKRLISHFLESILSSREEPRTQIQRRIASSLLLTEYILEPFEKTKNYISAIEGWVLFNSYTLALAEKNNLNDQYWRASYDLTILKINRELKLLKEEFLTRTTFLEGSWDGGLILKSRFVIVLGWLSAFELFLKQVNPSYKVDNRIYEQIRIHWNDFWYWGESATPFYVSMFLLADNFSDKKLSTRIIGDLIALLSSENKLDQDNGSSPYADPYHSPEEVLLSEYGNKKMDSKSFRGLSYHLESLIDMMVRRNNRSFLASFWKDISLVRVCEFLPSPALKAYNWYCDAGQQIERYFDRPQSWGKLREDEAQVTYNSMPNLLINNPFLRYFLLCYPHRLGRATLKALDSTISVPKTQN